MVFGVNTTCNIAKTVPNFTRQTATEIICNNFEILLSVFSQAKYRYKSFHYPYEEPVLPDVHFLLGSDEKTIPAFSSGKGDKIHSICLLPVFMGVLIEAVCEFE